MRPKMNGINAYLLLNSLWPSDVIRRQGTESTLAQVMACCLMAPSHYLNQCWLIFSKVLWHSSEGIIIRRSEDTNQKIKIENYIFRILSRSPRGQWVDSDSAWVLGSDFESKLNIHLNLKLNTCITINQTYIQIIDNIYPCIIHL